MAATDLRESEGGSAQRKNKNQQRMDKFGQGSENLIAPTAEPEPPLIRRRSGRS